jgi:hypothetical protein
MLDRSRLRPQVRDDLMRLGLPRDGGYVVPAAAVNGAAVLLSLGIKYDWSFEAAFARANPHVRIIGVDPGIGRAVFARRLVRGAAATLAAAVRGDSRGRRKHAAAATNAIAYFRFFRGRARHIASAVAAAPGPGRVTLGALIHEAAPAAPHSVFVKMDIEGGEYEVLGCAVEHHRHISCIVAEFHRLGARSRAFNALLARLQEHFEIVHVHGNNYASFDRDNDFPDAVEVTLLHRDLMPAPAPTATCDYPRPDLDRPNLPSRPDHPLRFQ